MKHIKDILRLMRIEQWTKNALLADFMAKYGYEVYYDDPLFQVNVPK